MNILWINHKIDTNFEQENKERSSGFDFLGHCDHCCHFFSFQLSGKVNSTYMVVGRKGYRDVYEGAL